MYYYIVDPQKITQREFERVQNHLYSSLSEYKISGEVVRVTGLRTINQLVENAFHNGAKTIVAVGSDDTLHDVINAVKGRETTFGFIPIIDTEISEILGLHNINQAAKTIASRRIAELDMGSVNNPPASNGEIGRAGNYFFSKLSFGLGPSINNNKWNIFNLKLIQSLFHLPQFEVKFSADGLYQATVKVVGGMIINGRGNTCGHNHTTNPTDGVADVMLLPKLTKLQTLKYRKEILSGCYEKIPQASIVHVNKLEISTPQGLPLRVGNRVIAKTPAVIEIIPKTLKIIVGRDRKF